MLCSDLICDIFAYLSNTVFLLICSTLWDKRHRSSSSSVPFGVRQTEQEFIKSRNTGLNYLIENGYDTESTIEQQVVWGDHDQMGHVNVFNIIVFFSHLLCISVLSNDLFGFQNVRYLRYVETG